MTASFPIRVLVSHLDPLTQAGLSSALHAFPDFEVVNRAKTADGNVGVDVIAADYASGLSYLAETRSAGDHARILIVTTSDRECDIRHALKQGVRGYVLQGCSLEELARAVRDTYCGNVHLCPVIAQRLAESIYGNALTAREEEVLRCVVEGLCNKEVAKRLELSVGTVKSHLRAVYAKLDVKSRTHAVAVAGRRGILQSSRFSAQKVSRPVRVNRDDLPAILNEGV